MPEWPWSGLAPSGLGSDDSGPKRHTPPCSESAAQKKSFCPQRRGLKRSPSGDPGVESPIPEKLRDPICVQAVSTNQILEMLRCEILHLLASK